MPRTHDYAPTGQRCIGTHDWHPKGRLNVTGALLAGALSSVGLTEANIDAEILNLWRAGDRISERPPVSVPVMDRATVHRRSDTKAAIADEGAFREAFGNRFHIIPRRTFFSGRERLRR